MIFHSLVGFEKGNRNEAAVGSTVVVLDEALPILKHQGSRKSALAARRLE